MLELTKLHFTSCAVLCCVLLPFLPQPLSESLTSLHDAAKWGDLEATERLLNEGADVNGVVSGHLGGGSRGVWQGGVE
jgi:hypothetical protein